ncbi:hypothetical protein V1519DRAFT_499561 [Lipomyces tetrasporus]
MLSPSPKAHGTGTKAGDLIETEAIYRVLGKGASKNCKLWIGSVKPNIGHLEAAAGVAGIIKGILPLEHGLIPPNVLFSKPNPAIPFDEWNIGVPTKLTPWPVAHTKRMSISGFGMGGTTGHVVLDASHDHAGFKRNADALVEHLDTLGPAAKSPEFLANLAHTLLGARSSLSWRATCLAESATELREYLTTKPGDGATRDSSSSTSHPRIGFVFTGQGAQWARMGVEMLELGTQLPVLPTSFETWVAFGIQSENLPTSGEWPRRGSGLMRPIFDERKVFAPTAEGRDGLPQRAYEQVFGSYSASIADIEPLHGQDGYGNDDSEPAPIMVSSVTGHERPWWASGADSKPSQHQECWVHVNAHARENAIHTSLELAAEPFVAGIPLCLSQVNGDKNARQLTDLPPYQWNHSKAFRHETRIQRELVTRRFPTKSIIGALVPMMDESQHLWRNFIRLADEPWIGGHMVGGTVLFPAAGLMSMALEAAQQLPQLALGTARHEHCPADGPEPATSPEPIYDTGPAQII